MFRVEELSVSSSPHFIHHSWFQVDKHAPRNVFTGPSLAEEGVEGVITSPDGLVRWHLSIRLDTVLQTVELPTGVADLDSGLSDVY